MVNCPSLSFICLTVKLERLTRKQSRQMINEALEIWYTFQCQGITCHAE